MRNVLSESDIHEIVAASDAFMPDIIVFDVSGFRCAAVAKDVVEVVGLRSTMPIPGTKAWVTGCMKHGMGLLPVINLAHFLRASPTETKGAPDVLVVKDALQTDPVGMIVNQVVGFCSKEQLSTASGSAKIPKALHPYIRSLCDDHTGRPCVFIDLLKIIQSETFRDLEI